VIIPDAVSALERSEDFAPKRLKRSDVANLRDLYAAAYAAPRNIDEKTRTGAWVKRVTVWLPRDKKSVTVAKLGRGTPGVSVTANWSLRHVVGLDVTIVAHQCYGGRRDFKLKVAEHRFRTTTNQTQFCREIASAVRRGLGWCAWKTG